MTKSSEYWAKRQEQLLDSQMQKADELEKWVKEQFDLAVANIEDEINKFYARFATNNEISLHEARKILTTDERKKFQMDVNEYIEKGKTLKYSDEWAKQLENASTTYRVSRLQALQLQMKQQANEAYSKYHIGMDETARDIYEDTYYKQIYIIQHGLGVGESFSKLDQAKIDKVITRPWAPDEKNFSERIWGDCNQLTKWLETNLTQAFIRGDSPDKLIKDTSKKFGVSKSNAARLIQTESAFFASQATLDGYEELEVEEYEVVATLDKRTSAICRDMDGKTFPLSEYKINVTAPPYHARCRTTTAPYFDDIVGERIARNADGTQYFVPASMTYNEWYDKYVVGNSAEHSAHKMFQNTATDLIQFEAYQQVLGSEIPKTFEEFQELKYNEPEKWSELKKLFRQVNWQVEALKQLEEGAVHKVPYQYTPNSVFDNYKDEKLDSRRYYGKTGKPRLDLDLSDHGNPKDHPDVPHAHDWNFKDAPYPDAPAELHGRLGKGRKLTLAEKIANKDILD